MFIDRGKKRGKTCKLQNGEGRDRKRETDSIN